VNNRLTAEIRAIIIKKTVIDFSIDFQLNGKLDWRKP